MKRGEIYIVDLGPGAGYEVSGVRPVVVVSNDVYNVGPLYLVVVPTVDTTDLVARIGFVVTKTESGLPNDISILSRQPRSLDASRFPEHPAGTIPAVLLKQIDSDLKDMLDL